MILTILGISGLILLCLVAIGTVWLSIRKKRLAMRRQLMRMQGQTRIGRVKVIDQNLN